MKTKTLFQVADQVLDPNGAVAFTHQVSTERGCIKTDYLIGFMSVSSGIGGKPVVVIDGDYDLGGRLEIPSETKVKFNDDGSLGFNHEGRDHRLSFYSNTPIHLS